MFVIHVLPYYFRVNKPEKMKTVGGGERFAFELAKALSKRVRVKLITFGPERRSIHENKALIIEVYPAIRLLRLNNLLSLSFLKELNDGSIIHCHGYWNDISFISTIYSKLKAKKVFITDHGGGGISLAYLFPYGKLVNGFLACSNFSAQWFKKYGTKIEVIYGGVDCEAFKPISSSKYRKVVFLGRIMPHKGINYLIEAMRDVEGSLVIMGHVVDINFYRYLLSLARTLKVNADFIIDPPHERIVYELSTAMALVLPSVYYDVYGRYHSRPELLGLVLLEAMACGTPVICTSVGGMPEVVIDGVDGFIVPPNNPSALREKILYLFNNPDIAIEMGKRGREKVERYFTWEKVAERCLREYGNGKS